MGGLLLTVAAVACGDSAAEDGPPTGGSGGSGGEGAGATDGGGGDGTGGVPIGDPPERAPGMTDLSILFPMPSSSEQMDALIAATDEGPSGVVFPASYFELMPQLSFNFPDKPSEYAGLRAIAARLDPCFPALEGETCRAQLRLVMQPIADVDGQLLASDAAVHLFFELSQEEFTGLLGDMTRAQSAEDAAGPLAVHPAMKSEGLDGEAAQKILASMRAYAGESRLSRATFMQLGGQGNVWFFGGFEIADGAGTPIGIAGGDVLQQRFENNAFIDPQDFFGLVDPVIPPDDFSVFYESKTARGETDDALWPAYEAALRTQNPDFHTPESVACVQCHTANAALEWADRNTDLESRESEARFTSDLDLTQPSNLFRDRSMTVRAFGYQDREPAVSKRTIFETARLVEFTREQYGF